MLHSGRLRPYSQNINSARLEMLARDKHFLLGTFVNKDLKKFYNIGPRPQVHFNLKMGCRVF
jgi:hypothetical protein